MANNFSKKLGTISTLEMHKLTDFQHQANFSNLGLYDAVYGLVPGKMMVSRNGTSYTVQRGICHVGGVLCEFESSNSLTSSVSADDVLIYVELNLEQKKVEVILENGPAVNFDAGDDLLANPIGVRRILLASTIGGVFKNESWHPRDYKNYEEYTDNSIDSIEQWVIDNYVPNRGVVNSSLLWSGENFLIDGFAPINLNLSDFNGNMQNVFTIIFKFQRYDDVNNEPIDDGWQEFEFSNSAGQGDGFYGGKYFTVGSHLTNMEVINKACNINFAGFVTPKSVDTGFTRNWILSRIEGKSR